MASGSGYFLTLDPGNENVAEIIGGNQLSGTMGLAFKTGVGVEGGIAVDVGLDNNGKPSSITKKTYIDGGLGLAPLIDGSLGKSWSTTPIKIF